MPVDGIEVLVTRGMVGSLSEAADRLKGSLRFQVVHGPKRAGAALPSREGVAQLEEAARFTAAIGAQSMVLHLWELPDSDEKFAGRLGAVVIAADIAERYAVRLLIETIPCRVSTPLRNIERVLEHEPRVGVALDTEFLAMHGELERALEAKWLWDDRHIGHVHIKDYDGNLSGPDGERRYLMPGDGLIDFPNVFRTLSERAYSGTVSLEGATYQEGGQPDIEAALRAIARMSHSPWAYS